jgi:hypothetical protein
MQHRFAPSGLVARCSLLTLPSTFQQLTASEILSVFKKTLGYCLCRRCDTVWLQAVATGGGKLPEAPVSNPAEDIPTDVDAADEPETDDIEEIMAGAKTAPAGRRVKSVVSSAVKAAAETVRRTGRSAKARVLRFHEAAPSLEETLKVRPYRLLLRVIGASCTVILPFSLEFFGYCRSLAQLLCGSDRVVI